jgi:transcriptional regulator with XRE-family HTH domain
MSTPASDPAVRLADWMSTAGIPSLRSLAQRSGVSRRQVTKLRQGDVQHLSIHDAMQLAQALNVSLPELLHLPPDNSVGLSTQSVQELTPRVRSQVLAQFQTDTLNILETLLLQWPTAAHMAQKNPNAPAVKLLPLLKPLAQLLEAWRIETIGTVGQVVPYAPQSHQWIGESAPPAENHPVQVSHVGYRQGEKLLYRAKVRMPVPGAL